jgi:hypothetical protein
VPANVANVPCATPATGICRLPALLGFGLNQRRDRRRERDDGGKCSCDGDAMHRVHLLFMFVFHPFTLRGRLAAELRESVGVDVLP